MARPLRIPLLLALVVSVALPAHAQIGRRLLDRARDAVRAPAEAATAATQAATSAVAGGSSRSALDYSRFLAMRYYPTRGEFVFGEPTDDHLIFPPDGVVGSADDHGEYQIRDAGGRVVARQAIGALNQTGSAAFMTLGTMGSPRTDGPLAAGAYTLDLVFHGQVASRIPFSITVADNGDPFDPETLYARDGPWRTLAYLSHPTERRDQALAFTAWVHARDLGAEDAPLRVVLERDGTPVASCKTDRCPFAATEGDIDAIDGAFVTYASRDAINAEPFTIGDLTPGAYALVIRTAGDGRVVQSYPFTGGAGTVAPHPRSATDHEPRHSFLTPRRMTGQMVNVSESLYWIEAAP